MRLGICHKTGARFKASRLIRTEVNYISGQATQKAYTEADFEEYVYLATLDKKTCRNCGHGDRKSCAELDGKRFKVKDAKVGVNKHPMHPFCRCSDYPYIPNSRKGTRAARDENGRSITVPDDMTYQEWYKKYVYNDEFVDNEGRMHYNYDVDKEQYERYKKKSAEVSKLTFEEFRFIKYNDESKWHQIKVITRSKNYLQNQLAYIYNGEKCFIPKYTMMEKVVSIAGKGTDTPIKDIKRLVAVHRGNEASWVKKAGKITSAKYIFDVHWYENDGKQYEMKMKNRKERKK